MKALIQSLASIGTALALGLGALSAGAQSPATAPSAPAPSATPCASPDEMTVTQLYGLWQLKLWPVSGGQEAQPVSSGAVLFERHPDHPGSVRGSLKRSAAGNDRQALVSGDVSNGAPQWS